MDSDSISKGTGTATTTTFRKGPRPPGEPNPLVEHPDDVRLWNMELDLDCGRYSKHIKINFPRPGHSQDASCMTDSSEAGIVTSPFPEHFQEAGRAVGPNSSKRDASCMMDSPETGIVTSPIPENFQEAGRGTGRKLSKRDASFMMDSPETGIVTSPFPEHFQEAGRATGRKLSKRDASCMTDFPETGIMAVKNRDETQCTVTVMKKLYLRIPFQRYEGPDENIIQAMRNEFQERSIRPAAIFFTYDQVEKAIDVTFGAGFAEKVKRNMETNTTFLLQCMNLDAVRKIENFRNVQEYEEGEEFSYAMSLFPRIVKEPPFLPTEENTGTCEVGLFAIVYPCTKILYGDDVFIVAPGAEEIVSSVYAVHNILKVPVPRTNKKTFQLIERLFFGIKTQKLFADLEETIKYCESGKFL